MGFVSEIAVEGGLDALVESYVDVLCEASPQAVQIGRGTFYRVLDSEVGATLEHLKSQLTVTLATRDAGEGLKAFLEKRDPDWQSVGVSDRAPRG
jgi:1,4-dihydroxy-2-naphthoyl-CoA synthase